MENGTNFSVNACNNETGRFDEISQSLYKIIRVLVLNIVVSSLQVSNTRTHFGRGREIYTTWFLFPWVTEQGKYTLLSLPLG